MSTPGPCADHWNSDLVLDPPAIVAAVLAAFRHSRAGVAVVDGSGRIVDANAAFAAHARQRLADLRGTSVDEVAGWASMTLARSPVDGTPGLELAVIMVGPGGEEGPLRQFVASSAAAMAMFDVDLRYLEASDRFMAEYGLQGSPERLRGLRYHDVFPDMPEVHRAACRQALAGEAVAARDSRFELPDGTVRWLRWEVRPWHTAGGEVGGVVLSSEDVTRQNLAEEAIARREQELRTLADNVPDVILRYDRELRVTFANAAIERFTGLAADRLLGRTLSAFGLPPELSEAWEEALIKVWETGHPLTLDFTATGRRIFPEGPPSVVARLFPEVADDGTVRGVIVIARDQSQEIAAQEALRDAAHDKDEFLAVLAHELRNPLAPIRTGLQMFDRVELAPQLSHARTIMKRQLGHLTRLVDDLLDLSRIGRDRLTLDRCPVSLGTVLEHGLEASRATVAGAGHVLTVRVFPEVLWVDGDLTRLAQVVSNLVNNAAKFTPRGGRIDVELRKHERHGVLEVTDSGIGLSAESLAGLFEMFGQGHEGPERGGLGIGLALARGLVELHGGWISATSPGKGLGSTFSVFLPLSEPGAEVAAPTPTVPSTFRPLDIVVIDDNEDSADSVASLFEMSGHRVRVAYDGPSGIGLVAQQSPDVVFCDIAMPGLTGYQVAAHLRADPRLGKTLLVALTGWGTESDKARCKEAGFDAHLTKPVDAAELERVLRSRMTSA